MHSAETMDENDPSFEQLKDPVLVLLPHEAEPVQTQIRRSDNERRTIWCKVFLLRKEPVLKVYMCSKANSGQKNEYMEMFALHHHAPKLGPCYMQFKVNDDIVAATRFAQVYHRHSSGGKATAGPRGAPRANGRRHRRRTIRHFLTMFRKKVERCALKQAAEDAEDVRDQDVLFE